MSSSRTDGYGIGCAKRLAGKRLLLGDLQYPSFAFDQSTAFVPLAFAVAVKNVMNFSHAQAKSPGYHRSKKKKNSWISEKHQKLVVNQSSQSLFSDGWLASCALKKRGALQVSYYRPAACTRIAKILTPIIWSESQFIYERHGSPGPDDIVSCEYAIILPHAYIAIATQRSGSLGCKCSSESSWIKPKCVHTRKREPFFR